MNDRGHSTQGVEKEHLFCIQNTIQKFMAEKKTVMEVRG